MSIFVDIEKKLGNFQLKVAFEAENEVLSLLGASGCGKSLTLRCIAGIETPDKGKIVLDGTTLFDSEKKIDLSPQKRRVGLLFQNYALFPNMTVLENLRAGCRRSCGKREREARIQDMMELFELTDLASQLPSQLSGGQQQRTALARILLSEPSVLLLDEPFSALDSHLRFRLEREMAQVIRRFGKTVLLVSHDRDEVYRLSDRVLVMHQGAVEVCDTREAVFQNPRTRQAAILTGCKNVAPCVHLPGNRVSVPEWGMTLEVPPSVQVPSHIGIRMHHICPGPGENTVCCDVLSEMENPFSYAVMLRPVNAPEAAPFGWELDKDTWRLLRSSPITIHIPKSAILCCVDSVSRNEENL